MTTPSDQLLQFVEAKDPDLAAHLRLAAELLDRPGGIHLKMAAHALREFGLLLPAALGIDRRRTGGDARVFRTLAPRWRALPTEIQGRGLYESMYSDSIYSDSSVGAGVNIPEDLFSETRRAFDAVADREEFATVMAAMVRILDPLGDKTYHAKIEPGVRHWHGLHNWFVKQCHAPSLDALEAERASFLEKWRLYEVSLRAMFGRASEAIPELLALAVRSPAEPGVLDQTLALLKKAEPRRRFFLALDDPEWLAPLEAEHLFDDPYPPERTGDLLSFPQWPQAQYLIKVAGRAGAEVARVIKRIGPTTRNATAQADFVDAALAMPEDDAASLVDVFVQWLSGPVYLRVPLVLGNLGARLAKSGQHTAALELLRAMLKFDVPTDKRGYSHSVVPRVPRFAFEMTLKEVELALVPVAAYEVLDLLCRRLRGAVRAENGDRPDDHSWIWMASLEPARKHAADVKVALAAAVQRAASTVASRSTADCEQVVARLRKEPFLIFRRVELQVLAVAAPTPTLIRERVLDQEMFEDHRVRREFDHLLAASWNRLGPEEQAVVLDWIRGGPNQRRLVERSIERDGKAPPDELLRQHRESWQLARLKPIAHLITGEGLELLESLTGRGIVPAQTPGTGVGVWVGPTSPLADEELGGKSIAEVLKFLREWTPPADPMTSSREGLARDLTELVAATPRKWSVEAREFRIGVDPTYVRSFLDGLIPSAGTEGAIEWGPVVELCRWAVAQPRELGRGRERDEDPDWSWARRTIASLLQRGLQRGLGLPFEHRQSVWAIIELLSTDPDPTADEGAGGDAEVVTLNSVRGVALHAAVEYALWCTRNLKEQGVTRTTWFDEIPEARTHFEEKLDKSREPSAAVPSVLAHYLPNLFYLDRGWLEQLLPRLFDELGPAWQVYLLYGQPHGAVVPLLTPYYLRAATEAEVPRSHEHASDLELRLPEHLLLLHAYFGEKLPQLEAILAAFFEHAPTRMRAHLIGFAGWHAEESKDLPPAARDRIMDLVERRVTAVTQAIGMKAREELAEWASLCAAEVFPDEWVLQIARLAVPACPASDSEMWVGERLAKIADTDLVGALEILRLVSARDLGPLGIHSWSDPAQKILSQSMARGGELGEHAIETIDNFTERGYSQFEHLLPK